jgi:phosphate starvation-inducible PhoH-like protein
MVENENIISQPAEKRIRKGPVTLHIKLTEEQKQAKATALQNVVTIFTGKPGTSKSTMTCAVALDLLIKGQVDKFIVTRPTVVVGPAIGFLPGEAFDFKEGKLAPYISPVLQTMYKLRSKEEIDNMIKKEKIQIMPLNFVRGHNFENCVVVIDEAQNLDFEELKALTTRIGKNCKMMFTSDLNQVDLFKKSRSAGNFFKHILDLPEVALVELTENFRHPLAISIMEKLDAIAEKENLTK